MKLQADAEAGVIPAQTVLGVRYLDGIEVKQDRAKAFQWLSVAAENRAARAQFHLARMYEHGWYVRRDVDRARKLYLSAGERGEWLAYVHLARIHARGHTERDTTQAVAYYQMALNESRNLADSPERIEATAYIESR